MKWFRFLLVISLLVLCREIREDRLVEQCNEQVSEVLVQENHEVEDNQIPDEVAGVLKFPSGLLQLPFMIAEDNEYYLHHDVTGNYDTKGAVFMDYRDHLWNQGILLYGHHVIYDDTAMFSPLLSLRNQETFEQHQVFEVWTRDEKRTYQITHVLESESLVLFDQTRSDFVSEEDFNNWIAYADQNNLIAADTRLEAEDCFVILQTCVDWQGSRKLLVIGKLVYTT